MFAMLRFLNYLTPDPDGSLIHFLQALGHFSHSHCCPCFQARYLAYHIIISHASSANPARLGIFSIPGNFRSQ